MLQCFWFSCVAYAASGVNFKVGFVKALSGPEAPCSADFEKLGVAIEVLALEVLDVVLENAEV